jgi:hypothetical protein
MSAAHGYKGFGSVPTDKRVAVAAFVATFDARLLSAPAVPA